MRRGLGARGRLRRLGAARRGGGTAVPALTLTATTTGAAQEVTIHRMTPATGKTLTLDWGDGSAPVTIAAGDETSKAHTYAAAGTYEVTVTNATDIVQIELHDSRLSGFQSAEVKSAAVTYFIMYSMGNAEAGRFDSADVSAWRPSTFYLLLMPAGYAGTFNSADVSDWRPSTFLLYLMPAGYAGTFNSADVSAWRPSDFRLYSMPSATFTLTITAGGFAGWTTARNVQIQDMGLLTAAVNAALWDLYQAATARTVTGGTINVGGTNEAPSGTFQAASACPVSAATDGKEIAHELLNDGCDAIAAGETWSTVTITNGA